MTTEDAVKKILGKAGTKVKLLVEREGVEKPLEFNLIRGRVEVETVLGVKRNADDAWNYVVDPENKICYVRLTQFSRQHVPRPGNGHAASWRRPASRASSSTCASTRAACSTAPSRSPTCSSTTA